MKKFLLGFTVIIAMTFAACQSSLPGGFLNYFEPITASESAVFIGSGKKYADARAHAIEQALVQGYSKIVAEFIETNPNTRNIDITIIMIR